MNKHVVYLIHFDRPLKHAKHYVGTSRQFDRRMELHRAGRGARLLQVLGELGIGWSVVRTWDGGRELERKIKNQKHAARYCPVCSVRITQAPELLTRPTKK